MLQGRGNDGHWVPDGSHPSDAVLHEYFNVLLNVLEQHLGERPAVQRYHDLRRGANVHPRGHHAGSSDALPPDHQHPHHPRLLMMMDVNVAADLHEQN